MRKWLLAIVAVLCFVSAAQAQYVKVLGVAEKSNSVVTAGQSSTTKAPRTFPGCTVTVYTPTGTTNLASIFSASTGTAKANPFTASSSDASYDFFIAPGTVFDVKFSGLGITTPFTRSGYNTLGGVATFTTAALPTPGTVGRFAKLTDGNRAVVYDNGTQWVAVTNDYNAKDWGAKTGSGFGAANRTAIIAAIAAANAAGGGVVTVPLGIYEIDGGTINLLSYVTVAGQVPSGGVNNGSVLKLMGTSGTIFTIGETLFNIKVKDLTLTTAIAQGGVGTYGIKATGASPTATQLIQFENLSVSGFDYGIAVLATDIDKAWQFSYVSLINYEANSVVEPLYIDSINSDWNIVGWTNYGTNDGMGINCRKCGTIKVDHANFLGPTGAGAVCTAGVHNPDFSQTAIHVESSHGAITVSNSQAEGYRKGFVNNFSGYDYPVTWINNVIGADIDLNQAVFFTINSSQIYDNTITVLNSAKVYMTGNNVDSRNTCLDAGTGIGGVTVTGASSAVIQRSALDGSDFSRPVSIGSVRPDNTDPDTAAVPWLRVGRPVAGQVLLRLGTTTAAGLFTNNFYYDVKRNDTTGFLDIYGVQAAPFKGLSINGPLESILANGTAPFILTSSTKSTNLNADLLDGLDWRAPGTIGGTTPGPGNFTTGSFSGNLTATNVIFNGTVTTNSTMTSLSANILTTTTVRKLVNVPVTLTDAANIATDASLANYFRVTLAGNRTLDAPTNATDGQLGIWEIIQDATGTRTLTITTAGAGFAFGTDIPSYTATVTASKRDFIECRYSGSLGKWVILNIVKGY